MTKIVSVIAAANQESTRDLIRESIISHAEAEAFNRLTSSQAIVELLNAIAASPNNHVVGRKHTRVLWESWPRILLFRVHSKAGTCVDPRLPLYIQSQQRSQPKSHGFPGYKLTQCQIWGKSTSAGPILDCLS